MIPKFLYFVHLGPAPMPDFARRNIDGWSAILPEDWRVEVVTDADRPETPYEAYYEAVGNYGAKSDLIRGELMFRYGGAYLDWDMEPVRDFTPVLTEGVGIAFGTTFAMTGRATIEGCFMASAPGHPVIAKYRDNVSARKSEIAPGTDWLNYTSCVAYDNAFVEVMGDCPPRRVPGYTQPVFQPFGNHGGALYLPYTAFYLSTQQARESVRERAKEWPLVFGYHGNAGSWQTTDEVTVESEK